VQASGDWLTIASVRRSWVVAALAAWLVVATAGAAAVQATKPSGGKPFGFADGGNIQTLSRSDLRRYLNGVEAAGARWIRVGIYWGVIQHAGPRSYDWKPFDRVVNAARRRRLAVLGVILYTPPWARAKGVPGTAPPLDLRDYAAFAGRAARHFGARVRAYEIWNEPNISAFWAPAPSAAAYTAMLELAYRAIKRARPAATVVSAGLSPFASYGTADAQHVNPITFLEQMYANGARGSMDAVGWHPYNFPWGLDYYGWSAWSQMAETTPSARSVMQANGDGAKRIWATEWGAPTGTSTSSVTDSGQATLVAAALQKLKSFRWAGPSFFYSYRDKGKDPSDREQNFGIVRYDWSRKPAYAAFQRVAGQFVRAP
jgi:hypothetical protein